MVGLLVEFACPSFQFNAASTQQRGMTVHQSIAFPLVSLVVCLCMAGCSSDKTGEGWSIDDGVEVLRPLPEVPTGAPSADAWSSTCERSQAVGEYDGKLLVRRYLPSAEPIAVDLATGEWEPAREIPRRWGDETLYAAGYRRIGHQEWVWGHPGIALYRPDSNAEWREATIGFVNIEQVNGVTIARGGADQEAACTMFRFGLYRHDGGDSWTRIRDNISDMGIADGRIFVTENTNEGLRLIVSDDAGTTWTQADTEHLGSPFEVVPYDGGYAMSSSGHVLISDDGLDWRSVDLPEESHLLGDMIDSPFGPLVFLNAPWGRPDFELLQLVDGRLQPFAVQPPEAGGLAVVDGRLAVLSRQKGILRYDLEAAEWTPVELALGPVACLAKDEEAFYAGNANKINRLGRDDGEQWEPLLLGGQRSGCIIPTDAGIFAKIQGHPDAPNDSNYFVAHYESGNWRLLEPPLSWAYVRRDGELFGCDDGILSRYELSGDVEQVATLASDSGRCVVVSANQQRAIVLASGSMFIIGLDDRGVTEAERGLLRRGENDQLRQIRDVFDTEDGLFMTFFALPEDQTNQDVLMRWMPEDEGWVEVAAPNASVDGGVRAFAASETTVYATTPQAVWRLENGLQWKQLVDWDGAAFSPYGFDAAGDELLLTTENFQVYHYLPPHN
ncbi:hypothetical protein FIV42_23340 [Persicimonas caeni]|uniref:Uncharacterized protein n=1 Tax=Persicimonas caeni TaxID=2292766 RepID=A0A4Y6PZA1_PERCE|nr:hypothetical protein [Persicimonas caeni]QDG53570.1 hypothetical protein FIV42_23340 [Persicimonas caeni]QED34791.1 hypothetical protein FRD00_23335 [Persicimonas caeni]